VRVLQGSCVSAREVHDAAVENLASRDVELPIG
jgi:hypothetical protein